MNQFQVGFPVGFAPRASVLSYLGISEIESWVVPQVAIIDRKGVVRAQSESGARRNCRPRITCASTWEDCWMKAGQNRLRRQRLLPRSLSTRRPASEGVFPQILPVSSEIIRLNEYPDYLDFDALSVRITISGGTPKRTGTMLVPMPVVTNR